MQTAVSIWRKLMLLLCMAAAVLSLSACTPYYDDYVGIWVGIDESDQRDIVMYEFEIVKAGGVSYYIRLTRSHYEVEDGVGAYWTSSQPRFMPGWYNEDNGQLQAPFGTLDYSISDGSIKFGSINFVRKAKNTALKLKYVAREAVKKAYPELPISD